MKLKLIVRCIKDSELSSKCPYPIDKDDLDTYLDSLVEDITTIDEVSNVKRMKLFITIKLSVFLDIKTLKAKIKPYFEGERFCVYKFVSLEKYS